MTSSDQPSGAPVESGDAGAQPVGSPPAGPPQRRWPSREQALGLLGAFLLGACLCGGAGLVIGAAAASHHSNQGPGPGQDGRDGFRRRDGIDNRRRDDFRLPPILPPPATVAPAVPAPSTSVTPTASPS